MNSREVLCLVVFNKVYSDAVFIAENVCMKEEHKKLLITYGVEIGAGLRMEGTNTVSALKAKGIINHDESLMLNNNTRLPTDLKKAEHLLMSILPYKPDWAFFEFARILKADVATEYLGFYLEP